MGNPYSNAMMPLAEAKNEATIIAFDTEDNGLGAPHNFLCACFYSKEEQRTFFNREEARAYMFRHRSYPATFFAHNLAYDLANLDYPEGTAQLLVAKGKLICANYKYQRRITRFMDTSNFFVGASIEALGKLFKIEKIGCSCKDVDFDIGTGLCKSCGMFNIKVVKGKQQTELPKTVLENMAIYCMKDCEICYNVAKMLLDLTNKHRARFKSYTAGSLAMRIFRTNYLDKEGWPKRPQRINDFERTSYYGGRTEVFHYGEHKHIYYEDINSSYPTAMFYKEFPKPWLWSLIREADWQDIRELHGVSMVTVTIPKMRIPPLPYKLPKTGKLIFPCGTWTASYTHPELVMAEKYGCIVKKVHHSVIYGEGFQPFKEYVSEMHKMKTVSSGIERDFYKMLLNSLSGKLGEKRVSSIRVPADKFEVCHCEIEQADNDGLCHFCDKYVIGGKTVVPDNNGWINIIGMRQPDPGHSFPVLIAYITAYGRIKLYEDRLKYQDAIYCDTDSCVSEVNHEEGRGRNLGEWEAKQYYNFIAFAPKLYDPGIEVSTGKKSAFKMKGIPKRHTFYFKCMNNVLGEHVSFTNPCSICGAELPANSKIYVYEKPLKWAEAIKRRLPPNQWGVVEKVMTMIDDKRVKTGKDSVPIAINDVFDGSFTDIVEKYAHLG